MNAVRITEHTETEDTPFPSLVALAPHHRVTLVDELNKLLAATLDLMLQVKQAHWNLRGRHFQSRHELFDQVYDGLESHADELAERIATLGGYAEGTVRMAATGSTLPPYDRVATSGDEHLLLVIRATADYCRMARATLARREVEADKVTEDLIIEGVRKTEKHLWFMESHVNHA